MMMREQLYTLSRQSIDVGCFVILATKACYVRISKVICHDEDDIRLRCAAARLSMGCRPAGQQRQHARQRDHEFAHVLSFSGGKV